MEVFDFGQLEKYNFENFKKSRPTQNCQSVSGNVGIYWDNISKYLANDVAILWVSAPTHVQAELFQLIVQHKHLNHYVMYNHNQTLNFLYLNGLSWNFQPMWQNPLLVLDL